MRPPHLGTLVAALAVTASLAGPSAALAYFDDGQGRPLPVQVHVVHSATPVPATIDRDDSPAWPVIVVAGVGAATLAGAGLRSARRRSATRSRIAA